MEFRFRPGIVQGDPFDADASDIRALLAGPGGIRRLLPAFHDGDGVWAVRHTPERDGSWRVLEIRDGTRKLRAALPAALMARRSPRALRFVRRDPRRPGRFADDLGNLVWPMGHNCAWSSDTPRALIRQLEGMAGAGLDWTRIWMCHWDGKNLDWPSDPAGGAISLGAARRWDAIVRAAERLGIRFQMVLHHHGQVSTKTNPNWNEHPWNKRNGGFLDSPIDFFTHPEALRRTRAKLRYAVARWGYSPSVFAWELFNEVEWTDAIVARRFDIVAEWHRDMAKHLRSIDPWNHLVTTSSDRGIPGLYDAMDFVQPHAYPPDAVAAVRGLVPAGKPTFFGEIGPGAFPLDREDGRFLVPALWAGIATQESGAPQYWTWETIERNHLLPSLRSAAGFVRASRLAAMTDLRPLETAVESNIRGRVAAGPGLGWAEASRTTFALRPDGAIDGLETMPAFLQGERHRAMFPYADLRLDLDAPATLRIRFRQVSKGGAAVSLSVDGRPGPQRRFDPADSDRDTDVVLAVEMDAGQRTVRLRNDGEDWIAIGGIEIDPFGPAMRAIGRGNRDHAVVWVERTVQGDEPVEAKVRVPGLAPGRHTAHFWDIERGRPVAASLRFQAFAGKPAVVALPAVARDIAFWTEPT